MMRTTRIPGTPGQNDTPNTDATVSRRHPGRVRSLAAAGLTGIAALALAGCQWTSPIQTDKAYAPADGAMFEMGGLHLQNVVVVSEGNGKPGTISALAVNNTQQPVKVGFANPQGQPGQQFDVPAGGSLQFGGQKEGAASVTLPQVPTTAGGMMPLSVITSAGQDVVNAPVLPPTGYYASLKPTAPATSTSPPSGTSTPSESSTDSARPHGTSTPTAESTSTPTATTEDDEHTDHDHN
ncbi:hypothetical protein [Dermatophilus congolensis]|nr:hypothetical protein [Dermatophilus congolensis]